jgi:hypothetical protein
MAIPIKVPTEINPSTAIGLLNVGPGSNPPIPPDPTKGNVTGVWGFVGLMIQSPSQTSSPPLTCGVFGQGGVVGVNGFAGAIADPDASGDGVIGFGGVNGVHGIATSGKGVSGKSETNEGVNGTSVSGPGVAGASTKSFGVQGTSTESAGVAGFSDKGNGVYGKTTGSGLAGLFEGNVKIDGTVTVSVDVVLTGGDCAEQFDTAGAQPIEPGTVVVIDEEGVLRESLEAYDRKVAGVISGAGDYKPAIVLDKRSSGPDRASVALVGKVCCKVDAQYSPINVGDLLTTSPTPGHAMKAAEPGKAFGAVIGKALRRMDEGQGLIPILIALQ